MKQTIVLQFADQKPYLFHIDSCSSDTVRLPYGGVAALVAPLAFLPVRAPYTLEYENRTLDIAKS